MELEKWFTDLLDKYKDYPEFKFESYMLRVEEAAERVKETSMRCCEDCERHERHLRAIDSLMKLLGEG